MANIVKSELIYRVQEQLATRRAESTIPARTDDLESMIGTVCRKFAEAFLRDPAKKWQMTKDYSFTFAADGTYDLTNASLDLLLESVDENCKLTVSSYDEDLDWTKDIVYLTKGEPYIGIPRWTVNANIIVTQTRTGDAAIDNTTTATLRGAVMVPTISDSAVSTTLPQRLEDEFVDFFVAMQLLRGQPLVNPVDSKPVSRGHSE